MNDVLEAGCAFFFRQGKHLIWWTPYIELYSVTEHNSYLRGLMDRFLPCLKMETEAITKMSCFFKTSGNGRSPKKEDYVSHIPLLDTLYMFLWFQHLHLLFGWDVHQLLPEACSSCQRWSAFHTQWLRCCECDSGMGLKGLFECLLCCSQCVCEGLFAMLNCNF